MLSTQNLASLPTIAEIRKTSKAIAVLDAILSPEFEFRYYAYNAHWDEELKEESASMTDGEGDDYMILFSPQGAIINGFSTDCVMNIWEDENSPSVWEGVLDSVPKEFQSFIETEPIPSMGSTFCIWRKNTDTAWKIGNIQFPKDPDSDGSASLLAILDGKPETYWAFAEDYYEVKLNIADVRAVYAHTPITKDLALKLNPELTDWEELKNDLAEIDFPHSL